MIHIYLFFLWGYFKEHKARIIFSILGISLGISLFFTTQVNSWRAEESIIDAEAGYPEKNYLGQFQANENGNFGEETFLKELFFILPNQIKFDPIIVVDSFYETEKESIVRFPMIGRDFSNYIQENTTNQSTKMDGNVKYLVSKSLSDTIFTANSSAKILLCNQKIEINKSNTKIIPKDGSFIAADIQYLQRLCGLEGKIQKVILLQNTRSDFPPQNLLSIIEFGKQKNWKWESSDFIRERSGKALGSLKVNLTIVSLISVLISFFMVANTFSGIYLARRKEFGILLSLGISRIQNLFLFLSQGLILGSIGSVLGILIGQSLLDFDFLSGNNPITDKIQTASYHQVPLPIYLSAVGIGLWGAIVSSLFSSLRAYFIQPIELIREKDTSVGFKNVKGLFLWSAKIGLLLCLLGTFIGFLPTPKSLLPGLVGVGLVIIGFLFFFPLLLVATITWILKALDRYFFLPTFRISWEEIKLEPLSNTLTSATILLASSLVLTLTTLTNSYEQTLIRWIDQDNHFDFSIINAAKLSSGLPGVPNSLLKIFSDDPKIKKAEPFIIKTKFPIRDNYYTLHVFPFESGENEIQVSSNFCYLEKKCKGDSIEIQTEKYGKVLFYIRSEKEHFFSERGTIMMNLENYKKYFSYTDLNSIRISFREKIEMDAGYNYLQNAIKKETQELKILSQESLKGLYLESMRAVFSILDSLIASSILISVLALITSLIYNVKEKSKLIATLRAVGMSRFQLFKFIYFQSLFFVFMGLAIGTLNSLIVSPLVIFGVNRNAFGWTLDFHYPLIMVFYFLVLIPLVSAIVSIYPFLTANQKPLREALNYE